MTRTSSADMDDPDTLHGWVSEKDSLLARVHTAARHLDPRNIQCERPVRQRPRGWRRPSKRSQIVPIVRRRSAPVDDRYADTEMPQIVRSTPMLAQARAVAPLSGQQLQRTPAGLEPTYRNPQNQSVRVRALASVRLCLFRPLRRPRRWYLRKP